MARRVSAIRQAYQKEQKRINRALLKLRSQGYDITQVQLPPEPKRVTKKALEELQDITPKKLRLQVTYKGYTPPKGTPLHTDGHFTTYKEARERAHRIELQKIDKIAREAEKEALANRERNIQSSLDYWNKNHPWTGEPEEPEPVVTDDTYVEEPSIYYDNITDEERAEFQQEDTEPEPVETYPSIEDNEIVYRDIKTGNEVERSPLAIEEGDETITYYDAYTGEVIKTEPNLHQWQGYDATELALDNLRYIIDRFPKNISNHFNALLDRMIDKHGVNVVGNAIQTMETRRGQSVLEALQVAPDAYEEIMRTFSELVEELPFTDEEKEHLREEYSLYEPYEEVT